MGEIARYHWSEIERAGRYFEGGECPRWVMELATAANVPLVAVADEAAHGWINQGDSPDDILRWYWDEIEEG